MSVDIKTTPTFRAGVPHELFKLGNFGAVSVSPDGNRILAARPVSGTGLFGTVPFTVTLNWQRALSDQSSAR